MKYYTLNRNLGSNRWWTNRDENPELFLDVPNYSIAQYLEELGYSIVELKCVNLNFDANKPFTISVNYNKTSDIKDYIVIVLDDNTSLCYYPTNDGIEYFNKQNEICRVNYVLDEWATFGTKFMYGMEKANLNVLHRRRFKNRMLLNPEVNNRQARILAIDTTNVIETQDQTTFHHESLGSDWHWTYQGATYEFIDVAEYRDVEINLELKDIVCHRIEGDPVWEDAFPWKDFKWNQSFRLSAGESKQYKYNDFYNPALNLRANLDIVATVSLLPLGEDRQQLKVEVQLDGWFSTANVGDPKPTWTAWAENSLKVWYEGGIIPPVDPVDDNTRNNFYVDYQLQPWYNARTQEEQIELLPIEKKVYTKTDFYTRYFSRTEDRYTWEGHDITLKNDTEDEEQVVQTLYDNSSGTNNFICPQVNYHGEESGYSATDPITVERKIIDDIFNNNNTYTYIVVKPSGMCKSSTGNWDPNYACDKRNIWFIIPIAYRHYKQPTDYEIWGRGNFMSNIKQISTMGASASITGVFTSVIPPTIIALSNRKVINALWTNFWTADNPAILGILGNYIGTFTYNNDGDDSIGIIPIEPKTFKFFIENNLFMTKTQDFLSRINHTPYALPTVIENEPFMYSPNCLNMGIIPQYTNQRTYLGNDYLDLSYTLNNIGIEALFLNNATFNYSANRLSTTREISNARNELAFDTGLPLPLDTSAYTDWLNGNATTESTSWKVYQNNHNLRIISGVLDNLGGFGNIITPDPFSAIRAGWKWLFGLGSDIATKTLQDQNEKMRLNSAFSNIKASSGTNVSLPSYSASCFAGDSGLVIYTNYIRPDMEDDVALSRLANGTPLNQILPFNTYYNRQVFNVVALDSQYNYVAIRKALKDTIGGFLTAYNDVFINAFIEKYLTGIRLWNHGEFQPEPTNHDPYNCKNNHEINPWTDN